MSVRPVACTRCQTLLPETLYNREWQSCIRCGAPLQIEVFPALTRPPPPATPGDALMMETEASCFYHPAKKAVVPCDSCGRFLCALCDVELGDGHFCAPCLESGKKAHKMPKLEKRRIRYDGLALMLALWPLLAIWPTIITAPLSIYIALRYWNAPSGLIPRSKIRFVLAIGFAALEIVGWIAGCYFLFTYLPSRL